MKVLYIVTAYDRHPGDGITPWLVETIHRLHDRGVGVEVLAPAYRGSNSAVIDDVVVHRFRYAPAALETLTHDQHTPDRIRERPAYAALLPGYVASSMWAGRRLARTGRFDVVHAHWPLPHALPGQAARRAGDIPLVLSFHGVEVTFARHAPVPGVVRFLRRAIRSADAVTANSTYTAGLIRELHDRTVDVVPFGSTVGEPEPDAAAGDPGGSAASGASGRHEASPREILFVGRLVERKGVQHLLDALARLGDGETGAHLHVVGDGPMRAGLEEIARTHGVIERVTFHGHVPTPELRARFAAADVFVLPAVHDAKGDVEGLGVVLIEALTYGKPVVASRAGGIVDVIRHEETGLLVPPGDPEALAAALRRLLDDPDLAGRLGQAGRRHVRNEFSWDAVLNRLTSVYDRVASSADVGPRPAATARGPG